MKFFIDTLGQAPLLKVVRRQLIREKEEKIRDDIKRLNQLKKVDAERVSREQLIKMFHEGVPRNDF